jgi:hypothetical protein
MDVGVGTDEEPFLHIIYSHMGLMIWGDDNMDLDWMNIICINIIWYLYYDTCAIIPLFWMVLYKFFHWLFVLMIINNKARKRNDDKNNYFENWISNHIENPSHPFDIIGFLR